MAKFPVSEKLDTAIHNGCYRAFKTYFFKNGEPYYPRGTPMGTDGSSNLSLIHRSLSNTRITAELLRNDADLLIPHQLNTQRDPIQVRAFQRGNKPLIWLILYFHGFQLYERSFTGDGKPALTEWQRWERLNKGCRIQDAQAWDAEIQAHKQCIRNGAVAMQQARVLRSQGQRAHAASEFRRAYEFYDRAATTVLAYHHGDENLIPFYQEEAVGHYQLAVEALIADIEQTTDSDQRILKRLQLSKYVMQSVLSDKLDNQNEKIKGTDWFFKRVEPYQIKATEEINWQNPLFAPFQQSKAAAGPAAKAAPGPKATLAVRVGPAGSSDVSSSSQESLHSKSD